MKTLKKFWKQNKYNLVAICIILAGIVYAAGQMYQRNKMDMFDMSHKTASIVVK